MEDCAGIATEQIALRLRPGTLELALAVDTGAGQTPRSGARDVVERQVTPLIGLGDLKRQDQPVTTVTDRDLALDLRNHLAFTRTSLERDYMHVGHPLETLVTKVRNQLGLLGIGEVADATLRLLHELDLWRLVD